MPTVTVLASTYSVSSATYVTVTNPSNMYTNVSSTTYATCTSTNASTTAYRVYLKGFDFSSIPDDAIVSSIVVRVKGSESNLSTSTTYAPLLGYSSGGSFYTLSGTTASSNFGTSVSTITVPTGSLTLANLKSYGTGFGIRLTIRRSSSNTQGYLYVYGAEVAITYTNPTYYNVTSSTSVGTISPSGTTSVIQGGTYNLLISGVTNPKVMDNNVDVTSQLSQSGSGTIYPSGVVASSGVTTSNIANAYTSASSTTYATISATSSAGRITFSFPSLNIPSGATCSNPQCTVKVGSDGGGADVVFKGGASNDLTLFGLSKTRISKGTSTVMPSVLRSATPADFNDFNFGFEIVTAFQVLYIYGITASVDYTLGSGTYRYILSNVQANHTIVVSSANAIYFKQNGSWVQASKAYKKVNGVWVEQNDLTTVFSSGTNYLKGN